MALRTQGCHPQKGREMRGFLLFHRPSPLTASACFLKLITFVEKKAGILC